MYRELFGVSIQQLQPKPKPTILPSKINPTSSPPCCSYKSTNLTNPSNPIKSDNYNYSVNSANNVNPAASANPTKSVDSLDIFSPLAVDILTILIPLTPTTLINKLESSTEQVAWSYNAWSEIKHQIAILFYLIFYCEINFNFSAIFPEKSNQREHVHICIKVPQCLTKQNEKLRPFFCRI